MTGESATNQINLLELPRLQKQLFATRAGEENVDRGINPLIADLAVEHHFHVTGAFEFLEDELVHPAAGFDQSRRYNGKRTCFFGIARRRKNLSRDFHRASVDTAAHGAAAARHRVVKRASCSRNRIEQNENVLTCLDQALRALDRELGDSGVALNVAVVRAGDDLCLWMRTFEIGHFFRTL